MEGTFKIIVREVTTKDGKKKFKTCKFVDEENKDKLIDCVLCKSVEDSTRDELYSCDKAQIRGDVSVDRYGYEYPRAFVRTITQIVKIN